MPSVSKSQQQAAGIALSAKRGETPVSKLYGAAKEMYDSMSEKELEDFASTETKNLPDKVTKEIQEIIREEIKKLTEADRYHRLEDKKALNKLYSLSKNLPSFANNVLKGNDIDLDWLDAIIKNLQYIRSKVESVRTSD